jgi:hypothetical protein
MKRFLLNICIAAFALIFLSSCNRSLAPKTEYVYKDSTVTVYNYKDTLIYVMKDSVVIDSIRVQVDSAGLVQLKPVKVKSKNAYVKAEIKNSVLTLEGGCDSLALKIKQLTIENTRLQSEKKETVQIVEKAYIPKFYKFCTYAFILLICVSGVYIYFKVWGLPKW